MKCTVAIFGLLSTVIVNASRSDFYGKNDNRAELFRILDDHVGTITIKLDDDEWTTMKNSTNKEIWTDFSADKYKVTNATMDFTVKGTDKYNVHLEPGQFYFQTGGSGSRVLAKTGFNIKLEDGSLFDVKSLRIRPNFRDATIMREKLASDILYKMGIPSTSAGYVNLKVNDEDLGIYIVSNKIKKDFIKKYFNDKSTSNLYECKDAYSRFETNTLATQCINTKEELVGQTEDIQAFTDAVNNATSMEDLEKVMDVDYVLRSVAFEFITISWDHLLAMSHNYFWYKRKDGKWIYLLNDYDEILGQDFNSLIFYSYGEFSDKSYIPEEKFLNMANLSLRDMDNDHKFLKYLIYDDDTRFRKIIGEIVKEVFNPKVLFPRIDEIAELIRDDVANSRTLDEKTGLCKGCFNNFGFNPQWNITQFDECLNNVNWKSNEFFMSVSYGLKFIIEERFKYICHTYAIDPDTLELIEPRPKVSFWGIKNNYEPAFDGIDFYSDRHVRFTYPDLDKEDYKQDSYNADPEKNNKPTNYVHPPFRYEMNVEEPISSECWSEALGYPCCKSSCRIYEIDDNGEWGYEDSHWCGLPSTCTTNAKCWSEKIGYPCCTSSCHIYEKDDNGEWGYENNQWCGIIKENCQN